MKFFSFQLSKFKKIKQLIERTNDLEHQNYYQVWSINVGFFKLVNIFDKYSYFKKFNIILKVIRDQILAKKKKYKLQELNLKENHSYKNIFITWYNYSEYPYYYDKYFDYKLTKKNTLNFLINHNQSAEFKHNNSIMYKISNSTELNIFDNILIVVNLIFFLLTKKFRKYDKYEIDISNKILQIVNKYNIRKIIMPYEGQLFQKNIINLVKKHNEKIKIIGYLHSSIPALPVEFIKTSNNVDVIYVHGNNHKKILLQCGWKNKDVKSIPSLRYNRSSKNYFSNKIFLPMVFTEKNLSSYTENLEYIFNNVGLINLETIIIKNHPLMNDSILHKNFINFFEKYKNNNIKKKKTKIKKEKKNISIFISTTAAIIEALEHGIIVIHICVDENLEAYNPYFWKDIKIIRLKKNVFLYKLKKMNQYIDYNNKNKKKITDKIFN